MTTNAISEGHYCDVAPGVRLHYAQCGDPRAPLMLMVHGFPEFWRAWEPLMPLLADRWHVVAPDLRGFNLSSKPEGAKAYRATLVAGDLAALIEQLGGGTAAVVGHDWGGAACWTLGTARPERISRLVILNSPHPVPFARALATDEAQQRASAYMNWLRAPGSEAALAEDDFRRLERMLVAMNGAQWFTGEVREAYRRAWSQPGALTGGVNYYRASPLHPATAHDPGASALSLREEDFVVRVPTLVIWGEQDSALLPVLLRGLERVVPDLRVERIAEATHWLVHEQPQAIADSIRRFAAG